MHGFGSFPDWWIREPECRLCRLHASRGLTGAHIAALKLYLTIAAIADFRSRLAEVSLADLADFAGLSRPQVAPGLAVLEALGVLETLRGEYRNRYRLLGPPDESALSGDKHFSKVPLDVLRESLRNLPNRGASALAALKLYLALLAIRLLPGQGIPYTYARVSHAKLQSYTGVRPAIVLTGLDHLFNHGLVHRRPERERPHEDDIAPGHPMYVYQLRGQFLDQVRAVRPAVPA